MPTGIYKRTKPVWNKGKKGIYSEEYKQKLSKAKKGKPSSMGMLGKKHTKEWKQKASERMKGNKQGFQKGYKFWLGKKRPNISGEKSFHWQGGIFPYPQEWKDDLKDSIRKRDYYICQLCGIHQDELEVKLDIHHIDYDKNNLNSDNLISLCRSCHRTKGTHGNLEFVKLFQYIITGEIPK